MWINTLIILYPALWCVLLVRIHKLYTHFLEAQLMWHVKLGDWTWAGQKGTDIKQSTECWSLERYWTNPSYRLQSEIQEFDYVALASKPYRRFLSLDCSYIEFILCQLLPPRWTSKYLCKENNSQNQNIM